MRAPAAQGRARGGSPGGRRQSPGGRRPHRVKKMALAWPWLPLRIPIHAVGFDGCAAATLTVTGDLYFRLCAYSGGLPLAQQRGRCAALRWIHDPSCIHARTGALWTCCVRAWWMGERRAPPCPTKSVEISPNSRRLPETKHNGTKRAGAAWCDGFELRRRVSGSPRICYACVHEWISEDTRTPS